MQEGLSDLPLKQVLRPLCERYHSSLLIFSPYLQGGGHWEESELTGLARFPQFTILGSPLSSHIFPQLFPLPYIWYENTQD